MLDPPEAATIGLFRLINRYLAESTQQGGQRPAQQDSTLRAVGAGISENRNTARNQARPHCRDAAVVRGRDDRCDHGRDGLAATFGARLFAGVVRNLVSEQTERPSLPHQEWQGLTDYRRGSRNAGGVI
jgi:hypothetical protein